MTWNLEYAKSKIKIQIIWQNYNNKISLDLGCQVINRLINNLSNKRLEIINDAFF